MRIPALRAARSFRNDAAPGSTYVQPRIGWYCGYTVCVLYQGVTYVRHFPGQYILEPILWWKEMSAYVIEAVGLLNE